MKIAIDLNDVIRAFTSQFASLYKKNIDRTFDIDDLDIWTNNLLNIFPFKDRKEYLSFIYDDYALELNGFSEMMHKNMGSRMTDWYEEVQDLEEVPDFTIISTGEYDRTIGATYFFLSKLAAKIRKVNLYLKEDNVWDDYDVIITANPAILSIKPVDKISVKINAPYNTESESDYEFESFIELMEDINNINKINKKQPKEDDTNR